MSYQYNYTRRLPFHVGMREDHSVVLLGKCINSRLSLSLTRDCSSSPGRSEGVSIADEFVHHCFRAHLLANVCQQFQISSPSDLIRHENTQEWLQSTAELILQGSIMPVELTNPHYSMHRSFVYTAFLYHDLREAVRYEEGSHVIRQWRMWLPIFLGTKCHNYATEAVNLLANLKADFPKHIAYITIHNLTVNINGNPGHGKAIDQMVEHYNL